MAQVDHQGEDADKTPALTIGLPVYNGENYLAKTLDSLLAQTYRDFELIICDNASTDQTQAICQDYARRDSRIHYFRNDRNLGAGPNYDLCFHRARTKYFKWHAHDDLLAPDFLARSIEALEKNPEAVLCSVAVTEIGPDDEVLRCYSNDLNGIESPRPSRRFAPMILNRHSCTDFFGVFVRAALEGSQLHGTYGGSDRVLLAQMSLRGPFVSIPEPLFFNREHPARFTRADLVARNQTGDWLDTTRKHKKQFHYWTVYGSYWKMVNQEVHEPSERMTCYLLLLRWWFVKFNARDMLQELLWNVSPRLQSVVVQTKRKLLGARGMHRPGTPI